MTLPPRNNRRYFLRAIGSAVASASSFLALSRIGSAATGQGTFASQFLEKGRVVILPDGYYDPEQKVFVEAGSSRPMVTQVKMTGTWTGSYETKCRYYEFPKDEPPYCGDYYDDYVCHPDGFVEEGDEVGC